MKTRALMLSAALLGLASLYGCATQPKTLYYWGSYQDQVYDYLKAPGGGDAQKQILALEQGLEKAKAANSALPPGYHAQLGMLYYSQGKVDQAVAQLEMEKSEFPESTPFMDRLLAKFKKN